MQFLSKKKEKIQLYFYQFLAIKFLDLYPDPDSLEMLDSDPYPDSDSINPDPQH